MLKEEDPRFYMLLNYDTFLSQFFRGHYNLDQILSYLDLKIKHIYAFRHKLGKGNFVKDASLVRYRLIFDSALSIGRG